MMPVNKFQQIAMVLFLNNNRKKNNLNITTKTSLQFFSTLESKPCALFHVALTQRNSNYSQNRFHVSQPVSNRGKEPQMRLSNMRKGKLHLAVISKLGKYQGFISIARDPYLRGINKIGVNTSGQCQICITFIERMDGFSWKLGRSYKNSKSINYKQS